MQPLAVAEPELPAKKPPLALQWLMDYNKKGLLEL